MSITPDKSQSTYSPAPPDPGVKQGGRRPLLVGVAIGVALTILVGAAAFFGLRAHSNSQQTDAVAAAAVVVPWSDYRPGFQHELEAENCQQLAQVWGASSDDIGDIAERALHGHGNDALRAYATALAKSKNCP